MNTPIKNFELYNQSEIARRAGVSQSYVSRLLRGKVQNKKVLERIKRIISEREAA